MESTTERIEIVYGIQLSPFGYCVIGRTTRGICHLSFADTRSNLKARKVILDTWPKATLIRNDTQIEPYYAQIFSRRSTKQPIPILVQGTNFQIKVWKALLAIPKGAAASYTDIARAVGSPRAVRAVGTACGKNPVGFLIPCHRVLASGGKLGGYHWGVKRKKTMLAWEAMQAA